MSDISKDKSKDFKVKAANFIILNDFAMGLAIGLIPILYLTKKLNNKVVYREFNSHFNSPSNLMNRVNTNDFYKDTLIRTGILFVFNYAAVYLFYTTYADEEVKLSILKNEQEELKLLAEREDKSIQLKSRLEDCSSVDILDDKKLNNIISSTKSNLKSSNRINEYINKKNI